ncbi:hypothetical protein IscW_ISCW011691 [Ixodes scapularis]|uniref:Uncharacterized protein n=1 Tax=Ixodes scapularis TaxID=6945 RepID=B7Q6C5_IXOSC|nr:hypothetical protein IscW_ISCW011691 [Ixodes scapularis]|eukprot:XP_002411938.1 hypothetical protein IscW_ISCW011691 [Ixodes scapularis]
MTKLLGWPIHETNYESFRPTFEQPTRPTEEVHFSLALATPSSFFETSWGDKRVLTQPPTGYKHQFNTANIDKRSRTMERVGKNIVQLELPDGEPVVMYGSRMFVIAFAFTFKSEERLVSQLLSSGTARLMQKQS